MLDKNYMTIYPSEKGDYIKEVLRLSEDIKEIDSAVQIDIIKALSNMGVRASYMVTIYYHDRKIEIADILSLYIELQVRERSLNYGV